MNSFIAWVGGKKILRKEIVKRFPSNYAEYKYVEVFGGAGWVLFYKDISKFEVYNDINGELVNLFRCVKYHPEALEKELEFILNSREVFNRFKTCNFEHMTDIQRAARYLYLIRASYSAKMGSFGVKSRDILNIEVLNNVHKRLSGTVIENKSFPDIIKYFNKEDVLLYLDPPYHNTEYFYDTGKFDFNEEKHILLRDMLEEFKGKFILSYNDDEFVKDLYKDFKIDVVSRPNNLLCTRKEFKELIIRNY